MWAIGGVGRVYLDCWLSLYIVGEPAPTALAFNMIQFQIKGK